jgi:23S rRNA pseudouridine2604 synthase
MKIDQYIASIGYTSRRKAYDLIGEGRVTVNGKKATYSTKYTVGDKVAVDEKPLQHREPKPIYLAYNKPKGVVCTTEKIKGNLVDALNYPEKVYPIGRLDKESEGLLLLTNVGPMIDKIANAAFGHEKEYVVTLNLPVRKKFLEEIMEGIQIADEFTKPCKAWPVEGTKRLFRIVLTQGLNRQIRRMCNAYDYAVIRLQRVRVMTVELGKLKPGEYRELTVEEIKVLHSQL